jgi:hypothetical protein
MSRKSTFPQLLLSFLLIVIISACNLPGGAASVPPSPAAVAQPVATNTAAPVATVEVPPTAKPTEAPTESPTETPAPTAVSLTFTKDAFCRKGPGVQYFDKGSFKNGTTAQAEGRNDVEPRWWYMLMQNGDHCWVADTTVKPDPNAEALPIQKAEKSLPETPTDLYADRVCKPGGFAVTLNWTPSSTADGYYVYLNGEVIQEIKKATQKSYVIKLPLNEPQSYGLEAYNDIGKGEQIILEDPGCP